MRKDIIDGTVAFVGQMYPAGAPIACSIANNVASAETAS
jgi:hypothetical protein